MTTVVAVEIINIGTLLLPDIGFVTWSAKVYVMNEVCFRGTVYSFVRNGFDVVNVSPSRPET